MDDKENKRIMKLQHIEIIDSTLREGEQAPGVVFTEATRRSIITGLHRVGIDEIELGVAATVYAHLPGLVREARRITDNACRLALWCRCRQEDITFAASCTPDVVSLSIPVSDNHIQERLKKDKAWVKTTLACSVQQALALGIPYVSVGLEDASRADIDFLVAVAKTAAEQGAARIRLADTVGICSPGRMAELVSTVQKVTKLPVGVHCHNDFGMATANSVAALEAGAKFLDATVLGIGERAGNCRLEEAVGYLSLVREQIRYRPELLPELCQTVATATGKGIADNHPLIGSAIFTCESGLHQHGLSINPSIYEPYAPERVGGARKLRFGRKTGTKAIQLQLRKAGIRLNEMQIHSLVCHVRSNGHVLNKEQLLRLAAECC
ncbi:MAG: hypothetical protein D3915_01900 [Candidatus Electrothrix sp. AU1_5]|nr:hypothetical protein [Candidatus Electrothrix gigas]